MDRWVVLVTERNVYPPKHGCDARISSVIAGLRKFGYRVYLIGSSRSTAGQAMSMVDDGELVDGPIWQGMNTNNFDLSEYAKAVHRVLREKDIAAVMVEYLWMASLFDGVDGPLKILDTHDMMHVMYDLYVPRGMYCWINISRENEAKLLSKADIVVAIQGEEAAEFRKMLPGHKVIELGHPVNAVPAGCDETADIIMVVGSDNPSNVHGINEFMPYWETVMERVPGAELRVYGNLANQVKDGPGLVRYGFFNDLSRAYSAAKLVINPVELGTGLKIKTVEAMGMGKVVVAMKHGVEGIGEKGVCACRDYAHMASEIVRLIGDPLARWKIESDALEVVRENYSDETVFGPLLAEMNAHNSEDGVRACSAPEIVP